MVSASIKMNTCIPAVQLGYVVVEGLLMTGGTKPVRSSMGLYSDELQEDQLMPRVWFTCLVKE